MPKNTSSKKQRKRANSQKNEEEIDKEIENIKKIKVNLNENNSAINEMNERINLQLYIPFEIICIHCQCALSIEELALKD